MGSKKKTTQTTNQTSTAAPPSWTMPGISFASGQVTDALQANADAPAYAGDFIANFDPNLISSAQGAYEGAAERSSALADFSQTQLMDLFAPRDSQQLLQSAIDAAIDPVYRRLQEQTLPGITNSALQSGAYTNDRALGVVPGEAIRDTQEEAARLAATMGYQGFQAEEDRRLQRANMLPSLTNLIGQLSSAEGDLYGASANLGLDYDQRVLDNALAEHQYDVTSPYERIAPAVSLLQALSGNYGTQTQNGTSTTVEKSGGLGQVLQGALGVAGMAAGLGAFGPLGAAASTATGMASSAGNGMGSITAPLSNWTSQLFQQPTMQTLAR